MIAWSNFFKSYIKLCEYKNNTNWSFWLCDENGKVKSRGARIANSNFDNFKWSSIPKGDHVDLNTDRFTDIIKNNKSVLSKLKSYLRG